MADHTFGNAHSVLQYKVGNDWVEPVCPQSMDILYQDVDYDTGRTADGMMHRNKVGMKRKLNLTYPPMTYEQAKTILDLVVSSTVDSFQVKFIDPTVDLTNPTTMTVYVGDRTAPIYSAGLGLFNAMSFNLIEM